MTKRILASLLTVLALVGIMMTAVAAENNNVVEIATADQLFAFAESVNKDGNTYSGKIVKLTADIDLGNRDWTPIGQSGGNAQAKSEFYGTFDGQGHTISNLNVPQSTYFDNGAFSSGLFGFINSHDVIIKNLNVDNATVEGYHYSGVIVGYTCGSIENCNVTNASVVSTHKNSDDCGDKAGIIAGYIREGGISGCTVVNCSVSACRDYGGIVGCLDSSAYVTDCTVKALEHTHIPGEGVNKTENFGNIVGRNNGGTLSDNTDLADDFTADDVEDDEQLDSWSWLFMYLLNQKFEVEATAGEGGVITPAGISNVKYGESITYDIIPDEGYGIAEVIVDGESVGAVSEYTFDKVKEAHTITVTFEKLVWDNPFEDIDSDAWYYAAVEYAYENGLMIGTSEKHFSPDAMVDRAMLVTILWRLENSPIVEAKADFSDVAEGEWYTEAVNWAYANGIVLGFGDGKFAPTEKLTREQVMAIFYRYAELKGYEAVEADNATEYAKDALISDWASEYISWADLIGMFDGIELSLEDMTEEISRAELSAYLSRFSGVYNA